MKPSAWGCLLSAFVSGHLAWGQAPGVLVESVGQCETSGGVLALAGTHVYVVDHWQNETLNTNVAGMRVIDVSRPDTPREVGCMVFQDAGQINFFQVTEDYAYVITDASRLRVVDLRDRTHPAERGSVKLGEVESLGACAVAYPWVYVTWGKYSEPDGSQGGLRIIDASNPEIPLAVAALDLGEAAGRASVSERFVYVLSGYFYSEVAGPSRYLHVVDARDPRHPQLVSTQRVTAFNIDGVISKCANDLLLLGDRGWGCHGGVVVLDISDAAHPRERGSYNVGRCVHSISVTGRYAYVGACGSDKVIDLSNPDAPLCAGELDKSWPERSVGVEASGAYVYVQSDYGVFRVVRLTQIPAITRHFITNGALNLQWDESAKGMKLQRATSLTNPDWQDLFGSEYTNAVSLPIWGGSEFFRLMKP